MTQSQTTIANELGEDREFADSLAILNWTDPVQNADWMRRLMVYLMSRGMSLEDASTAIAFYVAGMQHFLAKVNRHR